MDSSKQDKPSVKLQTACVLFHQSPTDSPIHAYVKHGQLYPLIDQGHDVNFSFMFLHCSGALRLAEMRNSYYP